MIFGKSDSQIRAERIRISKEEYTRRQAVLKDLYDNGETRYAWLPVHTSAGWCWLTKYYILHPIRTCEDNDGTRLYSGHHHNYKTINYAEKPKQKYFD